MRRARAVRVLIGVWVALGTLALAPRHTRADAAAGAPSLTARTPASTLGSPDSGIDADGGAPLPAHPVTPPNFELVDATSERPIRVLPAAEPGARALVYLHGYCGDVNAVGAFVPAAAAHGTLIALLGDQPCKDKPGRFKWSGDIRGLNTRIQRAVAHVNRALGQHLDPHDITLFGYSQGASRAESLARYYARSYPRLILGGPPHRPKAAHFAHVKAIAVFGGELEDTREMLGGADDLQAAGLHARFFLLPGVDHGDFGGELAGNRALTEILDFVAGVELRAVPPSGLPEALRLP
jgi:predicted esterase